MRLSLALVLGALGLAVAAAGCPRDTEGGTLPLLTTEDPVAEQALRDAEQAVTEGDLTNGEERYRAFLRDHAADPLVAVAKLDLGRLLLATSRPAEARPLFQEVATHDDPRLAERARLHEGVAAQLVGDSAEALALLSPLVDRTVDPEETQLLLRTLAAARLSTGDRAGAVEALDALLRQRLDETVRDETRQELQALTEQLTAEEANELATRLEHGGEAWPIVARRAMREAFTAGQLARVRELGGQLRAERVPLDAELQSMALRAERTGRVDPNAIGAILPLSGRGREVGQLALQALMLAAGQPADGPRVGGPRLFFRDTAGDPETAARAVDDLVTLHQVVAIVGPFDSRAATVAARRAEELGVPLFTLTPDARVVEAGSFVFRAAPTPAEEAEALLRHAKRHGAQSIAVLAPEHAYGQAMAEAARNLAEREGLTVAGVVLYPAGATSFREPLEQLRALRFDALLVPDHARAVSLVAPSLAAAGIGTDRPLRLLLPSVGYDAGLARSTGRYLQGAWISRPFHPDAADGEARRFREAFVARYRREPDLLAALARDVFELVRRSAEGLPEAEASRQIVRTRMAEANAPTATSLSGFSAARGPRQATAVY
ncbi:MAG: ABC transporter substrate-binding protein [Myxococcales bacterium]|nr:ABC transporter substrate-binding protein [Myxococcales bacterium]